MKTNELMTLAEACKLLPKKPSGKKVHLCTLWRWCRKGVKGVVLKAYPVGQQLYTTQADVEAFLDGLAHERRRRLAAERERGMQAAGARRRPRASESEAERILQRFGL